MSNKKHTATHVCDCHGWKFLLFTEGPFYNMNGSNAGAQTLPDDTSIRSTLLLSNRTLILFISTSALNTLLNLIFSIGLPLFPISQRG